MAACECCWKDRYYADDYYAVMKAHEDRGCVCVQPGEDGDKARAGQFWDDGAKRDIRVTP